MTPKRNQPFQACIQAAETVNSQQIDGGAVDPLMLTVSDRLKAHTDEARAKRQATVEERRRYQREDVLLLRRRGLVPLAIADELRLGLRRVVSYLEEAGEVIPSYLTTSSPPAKEPTVCRHCGKEL